MYYDRLRSTDSRFYQTATVVTPWGYHSDRYSGLSSAPISQMTDEYRHVSGRTMHVHHATIRYVGNPFGTWFGSDGTYSLLNPFYPVKPAFDEWSKYMPAISGGKLNGWHRKAFNQFSTRFPHLLSSGEFVQGISELEALIPKFQGDVLKDLAGLKLGYMFGWESTYSDFQTIVTAVSVIKRRMEQLRARYGKPTRLSFNRHEADDFVNVVDYYDYGYGLAQGFALKRVETHYHAGATLFQQLEHIDDALGILHSIISGLGLDNPILTIWNTLPFSFVTDMFLDISGRLESMLTLHPPGDWRLNNVYHSVKRKFYIDVVQPFDLSLIRPIFVDRKIWIGQFIIETYDRIPTLPVNPSDFSLGDLSANQLFVGYAFSIDR